MTRMFDTHCHLNYSVFDDQIGDVIDKARENGVKRFLIPGTNYEDSKRAVEIAEDFENVYAAIGIHPTEDLEAIDLLKTIRKLQELSENEKVVAIGEIGLDYYRFKAPASLQKKFFVEQVKLAAKLDKAIVIHNRQSSADSIQLIEENWVPHLENRIVYHCSEVFPKNIEHALKRNIFIGVDGDITYDKAKQDFIKNVPLELLVLETDSPFLTPEPIRSNKDKKFPNKPVNLRLIADKVAKIKNESIEKVIEVTTQNAMDLFRIA